MSIASREQLIQYSIRLTVEDKLKFRFGEVDLRVIAGVVLGTFLLLVGQLLFLFGAGFLAWRVAVSWLVDLVPSR